MPDTTEPDDVIRLAKQLAFMLKAMADEMEVDLDETTVQFRANGKDLLTVNAGDLVKKAQALQYGSLGDGDA